MKKNIWSFLTLALVIFIACDGSPGLIFNHGFYQPPDTTDYAMIPDFWQPVTTPGYLITALGSDNLGNIYISSSDSLFYRSADYGRTWQNITPEFSSRPDNADIFYSSPYMNLIVIADEGYFTSSTWYSRDQGRTWRRSAPEPYCTIRSYLMLKTGEIFAGGALHEESDGGLWISTDTCRTWSLTQIGEYNSIRGLAVNSANQIFANVYNDMDESQNLYTSTDQGASWQIVCPLTIGWVMAINRRDEIIIPGEESLIISKDNGMTWQEISAEPDMSDLDWIEKLVLDSRDNIYVPAYAHGRIRLFYTPYPYGDWYSLEGNIEFTYDSDILIHVNEYIYASSYNNGLFKSNRTTITMPD